MQNLDQTLELHRAELQQQLSKLEEQAQPVLDKMANIREELRILDELLGMRQVKPESDETGPDRSRPVPFLASKPADGRSRFTATASYWVPILESLVELGGSVHGDDVIVRVGKKMEAVLKPADYEMLPSGVQVRWQNRAAWQRLNMVKQGLLRSDSPRGVWEITPQGRAWLDARTKKAV